MAKSIRDVVVGELRKKGEARMPELIIPCRMDLKDLDAVADRVATLVAQVAELRASLAIVAIRLKQSTDTLEDLLTEEPQCDTPGSTSSCTCSRSCSSSRS